MMLLQCDVRMLTNQHVFNAGSVLMSYAMPSEVPSQLPRAGASALGGTESQINQDAQNYLNLRVGCLNLTSLWTALTLLFCSDLVRTLVLRACLATVLAVSKGCLIFDVCCGNKCRLAFSLGSLIQLI